MPQLDGTGPEGKGKETGRKLGRYSTASEEEKLSKLGKGLGKRRKSCKEKEIGKRVNAGLK